MSNHTLTGNQSGAVYISKLNLNNFELEEVKAADKKRKPENDNMTAQTSSVQYVDKDRVRNENEKRIFIMDQIVNYL